MDALNQEHVEEPGEQTNANTTRQDYLKLQERSIWRLFHEKLVFPGFPSGFFVRVTSRGRAKQCDIRSSPNVEKENFSRVL